MPARVEPVIETSCGVGCATRARPVSRSPQTTLSTPGGRNSAAISASSSVDDRRGVGRLEHHGVAGRERRRELPDRHHQRVVPRRDLARRRRSARAGRSEVWPAMYSPAERPSSTRAAPAKNRSWSTAGGISSLGGQPDAACRCCGTRRRRARRRAPRPRRRACSSARCRSRRGGVAPASRTPSAAARHRARRRRPAPETGAAAKTSPVRRVDQVGVAAVGRRRRTRRRRSCAVLLVGHVDLSAWPGCRDIATRCHLRH